MSLELWALLWKIVLVGSVGLFAALAIVVTIGGAIDIKRLFQTLRDDHAQQGADSPTETGKGK